MEWIDVKINIPQPGIPVLILTNYGNMDVCRLQIFEEDDLCWVNNMRPQHSNGGVTHWMPLPNPPKQ